MVVQFNLQTEFEMSSFNRSKDWPGPRNLVMGLVTLTMPNWGTASHHKANNSRGQLVYKI